MSNITLDSLLCSVGQLRGVGCDALELTVRAGRLLFGCDAIERNIVKFLDLADVLLNLCDILLDRSDLRKWGG